MENNILVHNMCDKKELQGMNKIDWKVQLKEDWLIRIRTWILTVKNVLEWI